VTITRRRYECGRYVSDAGRRKCGGCEREAATGLTCSSTGRERATVALDLEVVVDGEVYSARRISRRT